MPEEHIFIQAPSSPALAAATQVLVLEPSANQEHDFLSVFQIRERFQRITALDIRMKPRQGSKNTVEALLYRVTFQVVPYVLLTSKPSFHLISV